MTAIERTAYPRFKKKLTESELDEFYTPSPMKVAFINEAASGTKPGLFDNSIHLA